MQKFRKAEPHSKQTLYSGSFIIPGHVRSVGVPVTRKILLS